MKNVTTKTIAEQYGVTVETVRAWARRGWIPSLRAGRQPLRFDLKEVEQALRQRGYSRAPNGHVEQAFQANEETLDW